MKFRSVFLLFITNLSADILYTTDFEDFPVGDNKWIGTEDWFGLGLNNKNGVSFIEDDDLGGNLGKTAGLGGRQPLQTRATVLRFLNHDHIATDMPIIEVQTLISIADSSAGREHDDFFFSFFNDTGIRLAAIRFDNQPITDPNSEFGIWRETGINQFDTTTDFNHGTIYDLFIRINLSNNTWSAKLGIPLIGDLPLFTDELFTAVNTPINLGIIGYEWQLNSSNTANFGNNFMFVGDLIIESKFAPALTPKLVIGSTSFAKPVLTWTVESGVDYKVQYSTNLSVWMNDLPDSAIQADADGTESYIDLTCPSKRFYRIVANRPGS